jgi:hypothetical protein
LSQSDDDDDATTTPFLPQQHCWIACRPENAPHMQSRNQSKTAQLVLNQCCHQQGGLKHRSEDAMKRRLAIFFFCWRCLCSAGVGSSVGSMIVVVVIVVGRCGMLMPHPPLSSYRRISTTNFPRVTRLLPRRHWFVGKATVAWFLFGASQTPQEKTYCHPIDIAGCRRSHPTKKILVIK